MRLWVEIGNQQEPYSIGDVSASSWGCELKYLHMAESVLCSKSASSWGCELKGMQHFVSAKDKTVSLFVRLWVEILKIICQNHKIASASSWGCELKYSSRSFPFRFYGQPLREAVSWNNACAKQAVRLEESASSWGCELKCSVWLTYASCRQSASSWGCELKYWWRLQYHEWSWSASSWGCELKYQMGRWRTLECWSASSWGCELKFCDS